MDNNAKIYLSEQELQLMSNARFILTKRKIISLITKMFADVSSTMQQATTEKKEWLPEEVIKSSAKISKGENYLELPYVILDYPRIFAAGNIFAMRSMFWWGNFFSVTLQLAGNYKNCFQQMLLANINRHRLDDFFVCIQEDQWQHHFERDNYIPLDALDENEISDLFKARPFIKLAIRIPLQQPERAASLLLKAFENLLELLKTNFQGGEKGLSPVIPIEGSGL